jgi:hypothetical protein
VFLTFAMGQGDGGGEPVLRHLGKGAYTRVSLRFTHPAAYVQASGRDGHSRKKGLWPVSVTNPPRRMGGLRYSILGNFTRASQPCRVPPSVLVIVRHVVSRPPQRLWIACTLAPISFVTDCGQQSLEARNPFNPFGVYRSRASAAT